MFFLLTSQIFHLVVSWVVAQILPQLAASQGAALAVASARMILKRGNSGETLGEQRVNVTIFLLFSSSPTVLGALRLNFVGVSP